MPQYLFRHPETGEIIAVIQKMNDSHEFTDEAGVKYERVFTVPCAATDTHVDPFSAKDFVRRTNKKMSLGSMWEESAELSEKRKKKAGVDPVKEKSMAEYEKRTKKRHPGRKPEKIETKNFEVSFD